MAIRRLTIELDDVSDQNKQTTVPSLLGGDKEHPLQRTMPTDIPKYEEPLEESLVDQKNQTVEQKPGKTFADLILLCINNPRAMATILTFIPFIFFVPKIDSFAALRFPLAIGILLNCVWFLSPFVIRLCARKTNGK